MFEQHLKELVEAIAAVVVAACVLKVVAICINEHTNENGIKGVMGKIKKYIIVGIISVCILGITSTIAGYYGNYAEETGGGGHHLTQDGHSVGGAGGHF